MCSTISCTVVTVQSLYSHCNVHVCVYTHGNKHSYIHVCLYICLYTCLYTCLCTCVYKWPYTYLAHVDTHAHPRLHTHCPYICSHTGLVIWQRFLQRTSAVAVASADQKGLKAHEQLFRWRQFKRRRSSAGTLIVH